MNTKHTPGPWEIGHTVSDRIKIHSVPVKEKAEAEGRSWSESWVAQPLSAVCSKRGGSDAERAANARLIAAAPDLLAACKAMVRLIDVCGDAGEAAGDEYKTIDGSDALKACRAAIAKAEGAPHAK